MVASRTAVRSIEDFMSCLTSFKFKAAFNPWTDNCELSDAAESHRVRRRNLHSVLDACSKAEDVDIWIGRDLGWRGGRRTGVPFVDEHTLVSYGDSIEVSSLAKATIDPPLRERTATEVHFARSRVGKKIFFWNVFPFHPHELGNARSNRMHTREERAIGADILVTMLELISFQRVVTIGNDATAAAKEIGIECWPARHPSYGGQKDFHREINSHYGIQTSQGVHPDLFETHQSTGARSAV
jgi:hypothetical protein